MTAAYLSFLGVLAGAILQFFFAGFLEQRKHLRDLKAQAYLDYLKSIAETTITSSRPASSEHKNSLASVVSAKAKICLYG